jgi:hypothetical protein
MAAWVASAESSDPSVASRTFAGKVSISYLFSAGLMIFAAVIELLLGVKAEGQSLENVATPLTAIEEATGSSAASSAS